jgi:hypothetical protein
MSSKHTVGRKIFTTAKYKFGFVTVVLDPEDLEPTDKFTKDIKTALAKKTDDEKTKALKLVFDKFGHTYQTEVTLGGLLVTTDSTTTTATVSILDLMIRHGAHLVISKLKRSSKLRLRRSLRISRVWVSTLPRPRQLEAGVRMLSIR